MKKNKNELPDPERVKDTLTKLSEIFDKEPDCIVRVVPVEDEEKDDSWKDEPVFTWRELLEQYRRGYSEGFKTGRKEAQDEN